MGSVKKALKPITRVVDNIIPNEIKPALPYLAATFGAPYLAGTGLFGGIGNLALRKGLAGALTNVGTQALLGQKINPVSAAVSGLTIGGGEFIKPANIVGPPTGIQSVLQTAGDFLSPDKIGSPSLATFSKIGTAATVPVTAGTIEATQNAAIEANNAYEAYLREQEEAENEDIMTRKDFISRYLANAGFDQSTIDERLNELGYAANGGLMGTRVGFKNGGSLGDSMQSMKILLMKNEILAAGGGGFGGKDLDDKTDDEIIEIYEGMFGESKASGGRVGLAFGGMDPRGGKPTGDSILDSLIEESIDEETPPKGIMAAMDMFRKPNTGRVAQLFQQIEDGVNVSEAMAELLNVYGIDLYSKNAEGGVMDLKMGGMPAEMDLRKGGFVPIGAKEKADDVPARLSKNEFVMTADAVRAAGGGSVNKGAKRMYDLMNKLEAKV
jgi:hypothetical protein